MTPFLLPTLAPHFDETPASFLTRLAALHRRDTVPFCSDLRLDLRGVANGEPEAIARLSDLSGAPTGTLIANALRPDGDALRLRGERVLRTSLRRDHLLACAACLAEDVVSSALPPRAGAWGRVQWQMTHFRTCARHGLALVEIGADASRERIHDFGGRIAAALERIDEAVAATPPREASPLEAYLAARLDGRRGLSPWLDGLEFTVAATTCEMLGAVTPRDRRPRLKEFTDDDWRAAGARGFAVAAGGEPAILAWLQEMRGTCERKVGGKEELRGFYGKFYEWLNRAAQDIAYDPVREIVRRDALEWLPLASDDEVFGKPVGRRRLHSIYSASIEYGLHAGTVRKVLAARGLLPVGHEGKTPNLVLFDAGAADAVLATARDGVSLIEARDYLNADRVQTNLLHKHGFIKPAIKAVHKTAGALNGHVFRKQDLDDFLARLTRDAVEVDAAPEGAVRIAKAAKLANCGSHEIVTLILGARLAWVGRLRGVRGYSGVLVFAAEVKRLVRGTPFDGMAMLIVQQEMKTSYGVVRALIDSGHMPVKQVLNPATRHSVKLVDRADFERFNARYVSLAALAEWRGVHMRKLFVGLRSVGVHPALPEEEFHACFYLREIAEAAARRLEFD